MTNKTFVPIYMKTFYAKTNERDSLSMSLYVNWSKLFALSWTKPTQFSFKKKHKTNAIFISYENDDT